jgi:CoA:oxalate CoA-transferase
VAGCEDPAKANEILEAHGVGAEIVYSVVEAMQHPHNLARRGVRTVPDDVWGEITIPGVPIRFASMTGELDLRARELGADTREVLASVLGYDDARIEALLAGGAVRG